jgi:hypothetical protein
VLDDDVEPMRRTASRWCCQLDVEAERVAPVRE